MTLMTMAARNCPSSFVVRQFVEVVDEMPTTTMADAPRAPPSSSRTLLEQRCVRRWATAGQEDGADEAGEHGEPAN